MPRISAATVAEHRAAQRRALIEAGTELVSELGVSAVTPRSVAERAGLARSSFYEYFPSRDDLLAAVFLQALDEWAGELETGLATLAPGQPRLRAYVEATMRMTGDGKHDLATQLQAAELSPTSLELIMQLHERMTAPLGHVVAELDVADAATTAALVQGLLDAGMRLVVHGAPPDEVARSLEMVDGRLSPAAA